MSKEIKNAIITATFLGKENNGVFTCMLTVDYGGSIMNFGGYPLDNQQLDGHGKFVKRVGNAFGAQFLIELLDVLELNSYENLKGTYCRIETNYERIFKIGHILKDKWMVPEKLFGDVGKKKLPEGDEE